MRPVSGSTAIDARSGNEPADVADVTSKGPAQVAPPSVERWRKITSSPAALTPSEVQKKTAGPTGGFHTATDGSPQSAAPKGIGSLPASVKVAPPSVE